MGIEEKILEEELAEIDSIFDEDEEESGEGEEEREEGEKEEEGEEGEKEEDAEEEQEESQESKEDDNKEVSENEESEEKIEDKTEADRIKELLAKVDELQGQISSFSKQKTETKTKEDTEALDFLKDMDLEDVYEDPTKFNQILQQVASYSLKQAEQKILANIPEIIQSHLQETLSAKELAEKFYAENEDLQNVRNVVRACAEQVAQENQEWSVEKVLNEAAKRTRKTLGISLQTESNLGDPDKAGFIKTQKTGRRNKQQKISALQQELDEL